MSCEGACICSSIQIQTNRVVPVLVHICLRVAVNHFFSGFPARAGEKLGWLSQWKEKYSWTSRSLSSNGAPAKEATPATQERGKINVSTSPRSSLLTFYRLLLPESKAMPLTLRPFLREKLCRGIFVPRTFCQTS